MGAATSAALATLDRAYGGVLDAWDVPARMTGGALAPSDGSLRDRAAALAAVGFFLARLPPPRRSKSGELRISSSGRGALRAYLRRSVEGWARLDLARVLAWQAVLQWVPEPWIPVEPLRRAIARGAGFSDAYQDLSLTLELQPPGGARWLRERTLEGWPAVRNGLDAGRPQVVDLHVRAPTGQVEPIAAVLFGYEDSAHALSLDVHLPGAGWESRRLRFDLEALELGAPLALPTGPAVVVGFAPLGRAAGDPPALGVWWLLRALGLNRLVWRATRWLALRGERHNEAAAEPSAKGVVPKPTV